MFGSWKSISGKYSIFRKCYFLEKKMFSCVWLHFKKFSKKYFLVFGEEEGKDKPRQTQKKEKTVRSRSSQDRDRRHDCTARRSTRGDDRCSPIWALSSLSLSPIWAFSSLSLSHSFSGNDLKWKWGCKIIFGSRVKISVSKKPFSEKWNLPLLPNTWVWGKMISWNHFPPKQTHPSLLFWHIKAVIRMWALESLTL